MKTRLISPTWHVRVALLLSVLMAGCATRIVPFTGRTQTSSVSDARLNAQSALAYREFLLTEPQAQDAVQGNRVRAVASRLVSAVEAYFSETKQIDRLAEFTWEFNVVDNAEINAMCFPGGKVVVYGGLFDVITTDDHLATVLAHEMAHALANHTAENIADAHMMQAITGAMASAGGSSANQMSQMYHKLGQLGLLLPHSRYQEAEADHIGLIIMSLAGYTPHAAADFWRRMMQKSRSGRGTVFRKTHPADEDRMRQLEALAPTVMPIYQAVTKQVHKP